jgi:hypothetical protein
MGMKKNALNAHFLFVVFLSGYHCLDFREKLLDGPFDPTMQGSRRKGTVQARSPQADLDNFSIEGDQLHRTAVVGTDVGVELFDQSN